MNKFSSCRADPDVNQVAALEVAFFKVSRNILSRVCRIQLTDTDALSDLTHIAFSVIIS